METKSGQTVTNEKILLRAKRTMKKTNSKLKRSKQKLSLACKAYRWGGCTFYLVLNGGVKEREPLQIACFETSSKICKRDFCLLLTV